MLRLEGLEEIVVGAAAHGVDGHTDVVHGRDHDDGKAGLKSVNALEQGDAVDVLHHDVGEHQVEGVEFESFEGFATTAGQFDVESLALERGSDHGPHRGFVIDHENPHGLARLQICAERGREVRRLRNCELWSRTPALILLAHFLPLVRLVQPHRFCPAAIHCAVTEQKACCNRYQQKAPFAVSLRLRAARTACSMEC